jgi:hypothetical protein
MGLFNRFFSGRSSGQSGSADTVCRHTSLGPMWDSVADMGEQDRVSRYRCLDCHEILSAAAGRALLDRKTARESAA